MKILHIAPENVSGGMAHFAEGHRRRGNECRWVTFYPSKFGYTDDWCFNLKWMPSQDWVTKARRWTLKSKGRTDHTPLAGTPPIWKPANLGASCFFRFRDLLNAPQIYKCIAKWDLNNFDIYHFEQGLDPFRDGRWIRYLASKGKGVACFYHGSDLRNRGVVAKVHRHSRLNLTSEIDLMDRLPGMKYLFLPIDTDKISPQEKQTNDNSKIIIAHAARNRWYKGSDLIESTVLNLAQKYPIEWVMIENVSIQQALQMKSQADIFIDQITDYGGWGYGMSSVESLAMGIPTITKINDKVERFLKDIVPQNPHPFVSADADTLAIKLTELIENIDLRRHLSQKSREWVLNTHSIDSVINQLYQYYSELGWV